jgi:hypothetical protein
LIAAETKHSEDGAVARGKPLLLGGEGLVGAREREFAFPTAGKPGEVGERCGLLIWRDDNDGAWFLRRRMARGDATRQGGIRMEEQQSANCEQEKSGETHESLLVFYTTENRIRLGIH